MNLRVGADVDPASLPLEELMVRWSDMVWWAGLRPIFQRMLEVDLSLSESIMLRTLQRGPLTIAEAASCLNVQVLSTASRAVDRLVRDGYISRQEHPDDRRQKRLTLTEKGRALIDEFEQILLRGTRPLLTALDAEDREQFRLLLARILASSCEAGAQGPCAGGPFASPAAAHGAAHARQDAAAPGLVGALGLGE